MPNKTLSPAYHQSDVLPYCPKKKPINLSLHPTNQFLLSLSTYSQYLDTSHHSTLHNETKLPRPPTYQELGGILIVNTAPLIAHFITFTRGKFTNISFILLLIMLVLIMAYNILVPESILL